MASAAIRDGVVVWEWQDDLRHWQSYEAHVSDFIEDRYRSTTAGGRIYLQNIDRSLSAFAVDVSRFVQISQTGSYDYYYYY